ncbi:hypothetical protein P872_23740 [Rhodonellum psychrophilum GCM71 = DSM 17998]|uniref:Uncharacterized protein n=2 Tax=Rhodonellum TaxID=336827 RepID=U5C6Z0_9BACT|nr:hypothetical protein P872_23740 [Rhodonellum psychrophilum GCM71 = DSM 17998]SDZ12640.1 C-terminal domain of CHU protein family protein [Rhodonellum ikkaensis]
MPTSSLKKNILNLMTFTLFWVFFAGVLNSAWSRVSGYNLPQNLFSASTSNDPELTGPDRLCIVFGGVIGQFSANGDSGTDVYTWLITSAGGAEIFNRTGGSTFQNINVPFSEIGEYTIALTVRRGNDIIYQTSRNLTVLKGPELAILPDYLLCGGEPALITALNPSTPNLDQYTFEWTNGAGEIVGTENSLLVTAEGTYAISLFFTNSSGGADCLINGVTYVGPPSDFSLNISSSQTCLGETITVSPNIPVSGDWAYVKEGSPERISLGSGFGLSLDTSEDLGGPGIYQLFFSYINPRNPVCATERQVAIEINEGPKFQSSLVQSAANCTANDGEFNIVTISVLDKLEIEELGYQNLNVGPNETLSFTNIKPGIYTLSASLSGCTLTEILIVPNQDPPIDQIYDVESFGESCNDSGKEDGEIKVIFPMGVFTGTYRVVNESGNELSSGSITNTSSFVIPAPNGNYALEILNENGCTLPWPTLLEIPEINFVTFSIPGEFIVCESFELIPATGQDLNFTLTTPSEEEIIKGSGQAFIINQPGVYLLKGIGLGTESALCPRIREFVVTISDPFDFEPVLVDQDCFGIQLFEAKLNGIEPEKVSVRWMNEQLEIVGRGLQWFPISLGTFYLDVQPLGSGICPASPKQFQVELPVLQVDVELQAGSICENPSSTTISMQSELDQISRIEWVYIDLENNQFILTDFENETDIEIQDEGTYEVIVYNERGCELGRDLILIMKSMDEKRPEVNALYSICAESNYGETINPGDFESYNWFFGEDMLVSSSVDFKPQLAGQYFLLVKSREGCEYSVPFTVKEECDLKVSFPNAIIPATEGKGFLIYTNYLVDELEVWVYNKWGTLIFHCTNSDLIAEESTCFWDGTIDGEKITNGTYSIKVNFKNSERNINRTMLQSLSVLD